MSTTVKAALALLILSTATPVLASGAGVQEARAPARFERAVFVCATDVATRRAFEREHGSAPVFVTARQALAANGARERWATPRCMTEREHQRFVQLNANMASVR